jgi:hypothetical protein
VANHEEVDEMDNTTIEAIEADTGETMAPPRTVSVASEMWRGERLVRLSLRDPASVEWGGTAFLREEDARKLAAALGARDALLGFRADVVQGLRAIAGARPDLASTVETLARMVESYPIEQYLRGER